MCLGNVHWLGVHACLAYQLYNESDHYLARSYTTLMEVMYGQTFF